MMLTLKKQILAFCLLGITSSVANAVNTTLMVPLYATNQNSTTFVGNTFIHETDYGLLFSLDVHGLPPGLHELDIDENPSCENHGLASGQHFDPHHTGKHLGPYDKHGHLGDLPEVYVSRKGIVPLPVLAPRVLDFAEIKNHSIVISDDTSHGKEIIACGIITPSAVI